MHSYLPFSLLLLTVLIAAQLPAQEASSPVIAVGEALMAPGQQVTVAPIFSQAAVAGGEVLEVQDDQQLRIRWSGQPGTCPGTVMPPNPALTSGRPVLLSPEPGAETWTYQLDPAASALAGSASLSLFQPGDRFLFTPLSTVASVAGAPAGDGIFAANDDASGDTFDSGDLSVWARALNGNATWSDDQGNARNDTFVNPNRHLVFRRSATASTSRLLRLSGVAPRHDVTFRIPADGQAAEVWRIDGFQLPVNTAVASSGFWTGVASTGFAGAATPALADQVSLWNFTSQAWDDYYFKSTVTTGWRTVKNPSTAVNVANLRAGGLEGFFVRRMVGPQLNLIMRALPAPVVATNVLPTMIIDRDGDRLADGWEQVHDSNGLAPDADLDLDGLTNYQEYLLGGNPKTFDRPATPVIETRSPTPTSREAWVTFPAASGCRYRVEVRGSPDTAWRVIAPSIAGTGAPAQIRDTFYTAPLASRPGNLRFYRVVALTSQDSDADLVSDWEEENVYRTNPQLVDTDGDGLTDGAEIRDPLGQPLTFSFRGQAVTVTLDPACDRQVAPPGDWYRQAISVTVRRGTTPLRNAPVTFVLTNGMGEFSSNPGGVGGSQPILNATSDSDGVARAYLRVGDHTDADETAVIQGRIIAYVEDVTAAKVDQGYSTSFVAYVSKRIALPEVEPTVHLRPDQNLVMDHEGRVERWHGVTGRLVPTSVSTAKPQRQVVNGRPWLRFTGSERLDLGELFPLAESNGYSMNYRQFQIFFVAAPNGTRVSRPLTSTSVNPDPAAGGNGQRYLFASDFGSYGAGYSGQLPPAPVFYSIWKAKFGPRDTARKYVFPLLPKGLPANLGFSPTARYDASDAPLPVGAPPRIPGGQAAIHNDILAKLLDIDPNWANWSPISASVGSYETTTSEEFFYRLLPDWPAKTLRQEKEFGFGISVGQSDLQTFELRPSSLAATSATMALPKASLPSAPGVLGSIRAATSSLPSVHLNGREAIRSNFHPNFLTIRAPRFIGGWGGTDNHYQGDLGDTIIYHDYVDPRHVEDYLTSAYAGTSIGSSAPDRDGDKLPDWWERAFFAPHVGPYGVSYYQATSTGDDDGDRLSNALEYTHGTHPMRRDTDGDGWDDYVEVVTRKTNPRTWDTDSDFIPEGTAPNADAAPTSDTNSRVDTDKDGLSDGINRVGRTGLADNNLNGSSDLWEVLQWRTLNLPDPGARQRKPAANTVLSSSNLVSDRRLESSSPQAGTLPLPASENYLRGHGVYTDGPRYMPAGWDIAYAEDEETLHELEGRGYSIISGGDAAPWTVARQNSFPRAESFTMLASWDVDGRPVDSKALGRIPIKAPTPASKLLVAADDVLSNCETDRRLFSERVLYTQMRKFLATAPSLPSIHGGWRVGFAPADPFINALYPAASTSVHWIERLDPVRTDVKVKAEHIDQSTALLLATLGAGRSRMTKMARVSFQIPIDSSESKTMRIRDAAPEIWPMIGMIGQVDPNGEINDGVLRLEPGPGNSPQWIEVLPIQVTDEDTEPKDDVPDLGSGVDTLTQLVSEDGLPWIMIPEDKEGSNRLQIISERTGGGPASQLAVRIRNTQLGSIGASVNLTPSQQIGIPSEAVGEIDSIDPNAAVLDENDNYVYKPEVGDQLVAVPSDTTQGRQSVFTPIANLSVKPRKVIRLNFHPLDFHIHYRKGKELSHIHRSELKSIPEREKLESYLNRVYGPQCNVWFEVSVSKKEIVTLATETPSTSEPPGHATDDQLIAMKGFDLGGYKDEFTSEEDAILAKFKYNNARLNVYLIPETYEGAAFSVRIKDANGLWVGKARAYGYAQGDVKTDEGDEVKGTIFMTEATGTAFSQEHILAHEVGHIIGNLPHPEVAKESIRTPTLGQGPFCFLPGTDLRDRLMAGAEHYNRATGSPLLVKCEWDAIQAWIALNVDE